MQRARLLLLAVCSLVLLAAAGPASSASPKLRCGTEVLQTAARGTLSAWYSPGCYRQATRLLTPDLRQYSDAPSIITTAARRDRLRKLKIAVSKRAPAGKLTIRFTPATGSIRVSVFARKNGRFVVSAIGILRGAGGTLEAKLGRATRVRVSAGYVGSGDRPVIASRTLKR